MLTNLEFLDLGQQWPPPAEAERLERYRKNRLLWEGKHEEVFKANFGRLLREEDNASYEFVLNWPRRLSTLWADLLLGEIPTVSAGDAGSPEQVALERIIEENDFWNLAYEVVLDMSRYGVGVWKVRYNGRAIIEPIPPALWFPVYDEANVKNVIAHVIGWTYGDEKDKRLKVEIHTPGYIEHREYVVKAGQIGDLVDGPNVEATGVPYPLIRPVHNVSTSDNPVGTDDYEDLDSILAEMEVRIAQISRILDKHSDPNMYGDEAALELDERTGAWVFRGGGKFFPVRQGGVVPGYVTWDGQLEAQFRTLDWLMQQFYSLSETSPAAFGRLEQGLAESGSALKRLMLAPLAKVNRLRMRLDPAIKDVLWFAAALERAQGMQGAVELGDINITWNDGLPNDPREETDIAVQQVDAGLMSRETAIKRLHQLEGEQLEEELARIAAEQMQNVPALTMTPFTFGETEGGEGGES